MLTCSRSEKRHAEIGIKEMNLNKANAVSTPTVPEPSEAANSRLSSPDLTKDEASRFRGLVARVNFLSLDRPDLQFAAKTASQHMAQPKVCDWAKIKRIVQYLVKAYLLSKSLRGRKNLHKSQRHTLLGLIISIQDERQLSCTDSKECTSRGSNS